MDLDIADFCMLSLILIFVQETIPFHYRYECHHHLRQLYRILLNVDRYEYQATNPARVQYRSEPMSVLLGIFLLRTERKHLFLRQ
ncbi:UNVERIFIED_CONTAM: hypothetical protein NCL1_58384 [Trichonephila clavipes]